MNPRDNTFSIETAWLAIPGEIEAELSNILLYWEQFTPDLQKGGFAARIDQTNQVQQDAPRGSVLYARILWAFSAAYTHTRNPIHLELATRAFLYIREFLKDPENGGLYWSVDKDGQMLDGHKQIYAQSFGIYGMSEYYRATRDKKALEQALEWYSLIERHSRDPVHGGYIEAFTRDWAFLEDKRLSAKDENSAKSMNTHLHIVEAYANLYQVFPNLKLKTEILALLNIFEEKIINKNNYHLGLFFSNDWKMDSTIISFGHDIEAGWLLQACAESVGDEDAIRTAESNAVRITTAAMEGLDTDGGLWYEYNSNTKQLVFEKHWWPQAEALVGLCNAWELTGNAVYKTALVKNWHFIRNYIMDQKYGEWLWGIDRENLKIPDQDKVGIWKCPYHNTRACLELLKRVKP